MLVQGPWRHKRRRRARAAATRWRERTWASLASLGLCLAALVGCGRRAERADAPLPLPVQVLADTGRAMGRLRVEPPPLPDARSPAAAAPEVRAWVAEVSPVRPEAPAVPLPPEPAMPEPELPAPPVLVMDDDLKPPIARRPAQVVLPEPARRGRGPRVVELDVRIDESGAVSDAEWAGGSSDSALVASAVRGALGMSFFPAEQRGRPVAVWVRQRFDFAAARE